MAISRVFFSDLKSGKCSGVVEARLLQFSEARNVKRGGELMWADMLLVDLNHPRPTNQHRRQIPGPIRFHGGRKCRRRQRLELSQRESEEPRESLTSLKISALSNAITLKRLIRKGIPPVLRPEVWFSLSGAKKKKSTVPESYYSDLFD
ncbi:hypothetical protein Bca52824_076110 [Brassica carinata]|uniref:Rab-GAP TBC domain-containing protein n=1 Tax=Brassica carinata TaxID=52824 RepID=A0A8X7TX67_BRACI|nr:hypothetical protein Bca52824_076110 [Brassica carinata]